MTAAHTWDVVGPSDSDADLARASAAGDMNAFAVIYDRYADRLHDFCAGMLADRDAAADCVHDAFCIAATELPKLRDPNRLRPWLYSVVRNEALRQLRARHRESPSEELPDMTSTEPGPDTLASRTELADLMAEAAGGLSDRDRSVLELAFRHGLAGPELAEALGVSLTNANTIVHRLRETIERSLGALLVSRRVRAIGGCPELTAVLDNWDGHFTVLMRKRISRHIESCDTCDEQRRRLVSPVALLGAAPAFIPAPTWLREHTLREVELVSASASLTDGAGASRGRDKRDGRSSLGPVITFAVALFAALGSVALWFGAQPTTVEAPTQLVDTAPVQPTPPVAPTAAPPSAATPPAPSPEPTVASAPVPTVRPTAAAPPPPGVTSAAPTPISEPTLPAPPPVPSLPPLPPPLVLPPWPQFPQWSGGGPGRPDPKPGSQFPGPSGIASIPPTPVIPG